MRLELRSNGEVVVRQVDGMARRLGNTDALLDDLGEHMVWDSVPETFRRGGRPVPWPTSDWTSATVMRKNNRLQNSVRHEVTGGLLKVGTNLRYARQRHFGGTIKAKPGKALVFPIPSQVPATMQRPSRWGKRLFLLPSDSGDPDAVGVLASRSRTGEITPRFVLRKQVTQPARPFLVFVDEDLAWFEDRINQVAAEDGP